MLQRKVDYFTNESSEESKIDLPDEKFRKEERISDEDLRDIFMVLKK